MKGAFSVHKLSKPHGKARWRVEGNINGKRIRAFFPTKKEADERARLKNLELENYGHRYANMPDYLRVEALYCQELLNPIGASLTDAVTFYLKHARRGTVVYGDGELG